MNYVHALPYEEPDVFGAYEDANLARKRHWFHGLVIVIRSFTDWDGTTIGEGTTSVPDRALDSRHSIGSLWRDQTASESPIVDEPSRGIDVPAMLAETKRLAGWSWETLAKTLGCSRQAVHGWTLGREINQDNLVRLGRLHAAVKYLDRGNGEANRVLLAQDAGDGRTWIDVLANGEFELVRERLGAGKGRPTLTPIVPTYPTEKSHWFDRLAAETSSVDTDAPFALSANRKRIPVRRRE